MREILIRTGLNSCQQFACTISSWGRIWWRAIMHSITNHLAAGILAVAGIALVIYAFSRSTERAKLAVKLIVSAFIGWLIVKEIIPGFSKGGGEAVAALGLMLICGLIIAVSWRGTLIDLVASPLTSLYDGGNEEPEQKPFYSIANAKRKRAQYQEAIEEARQQLAKFPNDFEGVMLIASVQAENLRDLAAAENTLNHFCDWVNASEKQVASAWNTMADWYLKIGIDVDAARASLEKIIARFPETETALHAEQRLAHLGETEKILLNSQNRRAIAVPVGSKNLGLMDSMSHLMAKEIEPGKLAAAHVKHLAVHPNDSEVREKLATIYARDFHRLDLATMELEQLINEPRHKPKQIAGWLNLLANFQIELGAEVETVRATLETILARFPDLPIAEITQRRLARLNSEFKGLEKTEGIKMGTYEQNVGLKYGRPGPKS